MTRKALQALEVPDWKAKVSQHRERAKIDASFKEKTFSQLSQEEKDVLLRLMAERLGLIKAE